MSELREEDLVIIGDEAYLARDLCTQCHERPRGADGRYRLCYHCYAQRPEIKTYQAAYYQRVGKAKQAAYRAKLRAAP